MRRSTYFYLKKVSLVISIIIKASFSEHIHCFNTYQNLRLYSAQVLRFLSNDLDLFIVNLIYVRPDRQTNFIVSLGSDQIQSLGQKNQILKELNFIGIIKKTNSARSMEFICQYYNYYQYISSFLKYCLQTFDLLSLLKKWRALGNSSIHQHQSLMHFIYQGISESDQADYLKLRMELDFCLSEISQLDLIYCR